MIRKTLGFLILVSLITVTQGCEDKDQSNVFAEHPAEKAARIAFLDKRQKELESIVYPIFSNVWSGSKLSSCGLKRLEAGLKLCGEREGVGYQLDALSAGDSWLNRAGRDSVRTVEERARSITKGDKVLERLSYALGDGTNGIKSVYCSFDADMKIDQTS